MTTTPIAVPADIPDLDHAVHRNELKTAGFAMAQIRKAEREGRLVEFRKDFFGPPAFATLDAYQALLATIKAYQRLPGMAALVVSGSTAAQVHRLMPPVRVYRHVDQPIEFHNYSSGARGFRRASAHCTTDSRPSTSVEIEGVRVTTIARTLIDLRREHIHGDTTGFVVVGDRALREGRVTVVDLDAEVELLSRDVRGRIGDAVTALDGRAQTEAQSRSRMMITNLGLPKPDLCVDILDDDGAVVATPPFVWPEHRVIGFSEEVDDFCDFDRRGESGDRRDWHPSRDSRAPDTPRECANRAELDDRLRDLGYQVFRWTGERIDRHPCDPCNLRRALNTPLPPHFEDPFAW